MVKLRIIKDTDKLNEKTYTVGDTQYWKRGDKYYKWTSTEGRSECDKEDYMKAITGNVQNTNPSEDKAKVADDPTKWKNTRVLNYDDVDRDEAGYVDAPDSDAKEPINYSSEMNDIKKALSKVVLDNDDEYFELVGDLLNKKTMNKTPEVCKLEKAIDNLITDNDEEKRNLVYRIVSDTLDSKYKEQPKSKDKYSLDVDGISKDTIPSAKDDYYGTINSYRLGRSDDFKKDMKFIQDRKPGVTAKLVYGDKTIEYARKIGPNRWKTDSGKTMDDNSVASVAYDGGKTTINYMIKHEPSDDKSKKYKDLYAKAVADYEKSQTPEDKAELERINKHSAKRMGDFMAKLDHDIRHPSKNERDESESDYIKYDGVSDFDHTTWGVNGYETTIQKNDRGRGYYLQNEDYDMEFDTKKDLINYLRDSGAEFYGYDSEKDY